MGWLTTIVGVWRDGQWTEIEAGELPAVGETAYVLRAEEDPYLMLTRGRGEPRAEAAPLSASDQATEMAHLRPLPRCECGAAATEALYTGFNDLVRVYCTRHAKAALARFKRGERLR